MALKSVAVVVEFPTNCMPAMVLLLTEQAETVAGKIGINPPAVVARLVKVMDGFTDASVFGAPTRLPVTVPIFTAPPLTRMQLMAAADVEALLTAKFLKVFPCTEVGVPVPAKMIILLYNHAVVVVAPLMV